MKKTLLTLSIAMASCCSYAQNIFPSSGNVGIGTTSPSVPLSMGTSGGVINIATYDGGGSNMYGIGEGFSGLTFGAGISAGGTPQMFLGNNGSLGLGTMGATNFVGFSKIIDMTAASPGIIFHPTGNGLEAGIGTGGDGLTLIAYGASTAAGNNIIRFYTGNTNSSYTASERMRIDNVGNVGIGLASPNVPLHIAKSSTPFTNVPVQEWDPLVAGYNLTLSNFNSASGIDYRFTQFQGGNPLPVLTFQAGNVGIGTTIPDEKLSVLGNIHATEVKVDLSVPGPDYVLEPDYKLTALEELKTYVDKNHHLPEIPSAKQIEKEGISLGDMNMKLLKKVEELTLYLIEKDKQIEEQQKNNQSQQKQINELGQQLTTLTTILNKINK